MHWLQNARYYVFCRLVVKAVGYRDDAVTGTAEFALADYRTFRDSVVRQVLMERMWSDNAIILNTLCPLLRG